MGATVCEPGQTRSADPARGRRRDGGTALGGRARRGLLAVGVPRWRIAPALRPSLGCARRLGRAGAGRARGGRRASGAACGAPRRARPLGRARARSGFRAGAPRAGGRNVDRGRASRQRRYGDGRRARTRPLPLPGPRARCQRHRGNGGGRDHRRELFPRVHSPCRHPRHDGGRGRARRARHPSVLAAAGPQPLAR